MCNKNRKCCYALVVMLYNVSECSHKQICEITGYKSSCVGNIIARKIGSRKERGHVVRQKWGYQKTYPDFIVAIENEYLEGATTYELGDKYGVAHQTIGKWMRQRGHFRGKEYGSKKGTEVLKQRAIKKLQNKVKEDTGGSVVLVEFCGDTSKFKCNDCGAEFSLWRNSHGYKISCPKCREEEIKLRKEQREKIRKQAELAREEEYKKEKVCIICGKVFHSENHTQNKCSDKCRITYKIRKQRARERAKTAAKQKSELKKDKICASCGCVFHSKWKSKKYCDECAQLQRHCDHKVRAKKYGVEYDSSITLDSLIKRDNNICQICGEQCDKNDNRWNNGIGPLYPTIDHVIAMVNGGSHTWANVQLAHAYCNCAIKRDLTEEELTEEVITHAKEQAIAHKCA